MKKTPEAVDDFFVPEQVGASEDLRTRNLRSSSTLDLLYQFDPDESGQQSAKPTAKFMQHIGDANQPKNYSSPEFLRLRSIALGGKTGGRKLKRGPRKTEKKKSPSPARRRAQSAIFHSPKQDEAIKPKAILSVNSVISDRVIEKAEQENVELDMNLLLTLVNIDKSIFSGLDLDFEDSPWILAALCNDVNWLRSRSPTFFSQKYGDVGWFKKFSAVSNEIKSENITERNLLMLLGIGGHQQTIDDYFHMVLCRHPEFVDSTLNAASHYHQADLCEYLKQDFKASYLERYSVQ